MGVFSRELCLYLPLSACMIYWPLWKVKFLFVSKVSRGARGEYLLQLVVTGVIPLLCQRCLKAVPFDLDVDNLLELVPEGAELSQDELEDDTRDFLPVAKELDVAELVEDEILLALPVAPRHEKCGLPGAADAGERSNPFAALAGLKGKPN